MALMEEEGITLESLEQLSQREQSPFVNLLAGAGAELALRKISESGLKEKLWLRNYRELELDTYKRKRLEGIVFFLAEGRREGVKEELTELFQRIQREGIFLCSMEAPQKKMPFSVETKNRILLNICLEKYRIPFYLELKFSKETAVHATEVWLEDTFTGKKPVNYLGFPVEEYLAQGLYQVLDKLELLNDFSWYREIYDILAKELVDGRKVKDSLVKIIEKKPVPSLDKRLDTIKAYADYGYMKKKWKNECKRQEGEHPQWNEVIQLLTSFLAPLYETIIKDEIFFGDWMPHLLRYLQ